MGWKCFIARHPRGKSHSSSSGWLACKMEAADPAATWQALLFVTLWTAVHQTSLSFTISQSLPKLMSNESVMPSPHLILCCPLSSCLQSFPTSGSFPMSWLFVASGQSIGTSASASVLPMIIQGWIPLGLTGLISLLPKDSQESSTAPRFDNINSLALSLLYGPTLTSMHDHWKNHNFDYMDLCWQSDVSAF